MEFRPTLHRDGVALLPGAGMASLGLTSAAMAIYAARACQHAAGTLPAALDDSFRQRTIALDLLGDPRAMVPTEAAALADQALGPQWSVCDGSVVRTVAPDARDPCMPPLPDCAREERVLNVWIALDPCGIDTPGLELILPAAARPWRPALDPGDVLVFPDTTAHRTLLSPGMTRVRRSLEIRLRPQRAVAFYDRSLVERIALTEKAMAERRTLYDRWNGLAGREAKGWNGRAAAAAALLRGEAAVVDLGCGTMSLERHLDPATAYHPVDVVRRDSRTLVRDFNVEGPPALPAPAAACLGLIEYLFAPEAFLRALARSYRTCVVSYCITDAAVPMGPRRSHAWVNDFSRAAIEDLFRAAGWTIEHSAPFGTGQHLWRLRAAGA